MKAPAGLTRIFLLLMILAPLAITQPGRAGAGLPEEALRARVNLLWQAKQRNDWRGVYEMSDREFRRTVSLDKYRSGRREVINGFTIRSVTIDPADPGRATSMVIFKTIKFAQPFDISVRDEWLLEDGVWNLKLSNPRTPFDTMSK